MNARTLGIIILVSLIIGFFAGRSRIDSEPIIKYIKGDTITDSIPYPVPYDSIQIKYKYLPRITDTLYLDGDTVIVQGDIDTSAILADYLLKRLYKETLFDNDTIGSLNIETSVERNRLGSITYSFNPITKEITIPEKRLITPFIIGSYNTFNQFGIGGGLYINDVGVSLKYLNNTTMTNRGFEIGVFKSF